VALCAGTISQAGPDSDAQAKAREALRQKIAELETQPVSEAPATLTPATPDSDAQAKAREALRQKMAELEAQSVSEAPAAASEPASGAKAPVFAEPTPPAGNPPATPEQIERSRESIRQTIVELNEQDKAIVAAPAVPPPACQPEHPVTVSQPKPKVRRAPTPTAFDPIPAPPSTISASKEARLAELLKQYQADAVTPEQYHLERAKILAEP
jgi:hypothetical protein